MPHSKYKIPQCYPSKILPVFKGHGVQIPQPGNKDSNLPFWPPLRILLKQSPPVVLLSDPMTLEYLALKKYFILKNNIVESQAKFSKET